MSPVSVGRGTVDPGVDLSEGTKPSGLTSPDLSRSQESRQLKKTTIEVYEHVRSLVSLSTYGND